MSGPNDSEKKRPAPLLTHDLLALSFIFSSWGWSHIDDCLKKRLHLASKDSAASELVEIDLYPRILLRAASNGLKEIRWTVKAWTGGALIRLGWLLGKVVLTYNRSIEGKEELRRIFGSYVVGPISVAGDQSERIGVIFKPVMNPDRLDPQGEVFRLVDERDGDGWSEAVYVCMDPEWRSLLHGPNAPLERSSQG